MAIENKLGIHGDIELARMEELLTKRRALELFENNLLGTFEVGTFAGAFAYSCVSFPGCV